MICQATIIQTIIMLHRSLWPNFWLHLCLKGIRDSRLQHRYATRENEREWEEEKKDINRYGSWAVSVSWGWTASNYASEQRVFTRTARKWRFYADVTKRYSVWCYMSILAIFKYFAVTIYSKRSSLQLSYNCQSNSTALIKIMRT